MSKDMGQNHNTGVETDAPPDKAAAGDVSTTEHSSYDVDDSHGGHGDDAAAEAPTLVPTTLSQLVLPALILVIVAILVAAPVINAFSPRPASSPAATEQQGAQENTLAPAQSPTGVPASATQSPATPTNGVSINLPLIATQTAVAIVGEQGQIARVPVRLEFGGASFSVKQGSGLLPDWSTNQEATTATWIEGTVANHILYVPYNDNNTALFKASKPGDTLKLEMNTGRVFNFVINLAQRATNGPATTEGQFTVNAAMSQDHAGVTLFLIGDPATDRAVVQADFTGNIQ